MNNILSLLILVVALAACGTDPMGLNSSVNRQLDSAITNRVARHQSILLNAKNLNEKISIDASKVDKDIRGFWTTINLFDACTGTIEKADKYFDDLASKLNLEKEFFIKATQLHSKPEIIVAIKKNELKLFDLILSENNRTGF
jgi:hypothetical protein